MRKTSRSSGGEQSSSPTPFHHGKPADIADEAVLAPDGHTAAPCRDPARHGNCSPAFGSPGLFGSSPVDVAHSRILPEIK